MAEAAIDLEAMQFLVNVMNTAAGDLRGAKADLVGVLAGVSLDPHPPTPLETAAVWVESQVPGLRRRLALAQAIAASTPGFKAGNPVTIDESKLSTLSPDEAMRIGAEAASRIKKGGGGGPDHELAEWLQKYAADPYFSAALVKGTTPQQIADYLRDNGYHMGSTRSGGYADSEQAFQKMLADEKLIAAGLSTALGTATRSASPDLALPDDYADRFADAIVDRSNVNGEAAILGNLLKGGSFSTRFLDTVAPRVYDYERHELDGHWADRTPNDYWWAYDAGGNVITCRDPMAGVMAALGHNPEASQHFFTQGGDTSITIHGREVKVNERLQYLLQERTWSGSNHSDEGDGLGKALRAATTAFRNRELTGQWSAEIASQTIALIGSKTYFGRSGGFLGIGQDDGWKMYTGMRDEIADIVADYVPDLFREYSDNPGAPDRPGQPGWFSSANPVDLPGGPYGLLFDRGDMKNILQTLGEDPTNIDKISVATLAFNRVKVNYALSQIADPALKWKILNGDSVPEFVNPSKIGPSVLGAILLDAYDGKKSKEDLDKAKAEALKSWLDIAGSLPVLKIPGEGARLVYANWGFDQLKGAALDQLTKGPDGSATSLYGGRDVSDQEALKRDTMNMLLQNGFFDSSVMDIGSHATGGKGVAGPPPGALHRDEHGHVTGFEFGSDDYSNWVQGTSGPGNPSWWGLAPGVSLPDDVIGTYRQQFPNIR